LPITRKQKMMKTLFTAKNILSWRWSSILVAMLFVSAVNVNAQWENIPGKAIDIAAAGDTISAVWHIGESGAIFKWNEQSFAWENYAGKGERIAVESNGTPWIINNKQI